MATLTRYLSGLFLKRFVPVLLGFAVLLQLFDLLANADEVVGRHGDGAPVLMRYAGLRLPELIASLVPLAVLVGSMLTLTELGRRGELTAIEAAGVSFSRILFMLAPVGVAIPVFHFLLVEYVTPVTARALYEWDAEAKVRRRAPGPADPAPEVWFRDGMDVVGAAAVTDGARVLHDVMLFRREATGDLVGRTSARVARYIEGGWLLLDGDHLSTAAGGVVGPSRFDQRAWDTGLTPARIADLVAPPTILPLRSLIGFVARRERSTHPPHVYETWLHRRIAAPLSSLAMVLLAAPVARALPHGGGGVRNAWLGAAAAALGFLFFVTDGLLLVLGESGAVAPAVAAWGPVLGFAAFGVVGLFCVEGLGTGVRRPPRPTGLRRVQRRS